MSLSVQDRGWVDMLHLRQPGNGGMNGPNGGGLGGGAGQGDLFFGGDALQLSRAMALANKTGDMVAQVVLRSYAPWENFGLVFGGDPNTDSARVTTAIGVNLRNGEPLQGPPHTHAHETTSTVLGTTRHHGTSQDLTGGLGQDGTKTTIAHSGSNPAFHGYAPPIEVELAYSIYLSQGAPEVSAELSGRGFPSAEATLGFSDGNTITLQSYHVPTNILVQHAGPLSLIVPLPFDLGQMHW